MLADSTPNEVANTSDEENDTKTKMDDIIQSAALGNLFPGIPQQFVSLPVAQFDKLQDVLHPANLFRHTFLKNEYVLLQIFFAGKN